MDIAQQPPLLPVQPVAIAVVIAAAATVMIVIRPTPRQAALAEVVEAVAVVPAAVQSLAGQNRDLPFPTQPPKYNLTPIRQTVEKLVAEKPDLRDVFLCHAWDDRQGVAKELHDLLEAAGVKVWFSEKDLALGVPMMRAIDKGLANSRIGLVLVTPALLNRLPKEGVADKELSALLAGNQLVPIVHNTTYEALRNVSPLLASRSGLDTGEDTLAVVATKIAELITV
ncbi:toll/interleukin-1 receptor domain-containing protein [Klebsiella quasipneumoniae]|nr:toll/interleukin-1 receptor domain-containing protein [Klebsiella quasipneumoniae]